MKHVSLVCFWKVQWLFLPLQGHLIAPLALPLPPWAICLYVQMVFLIFWVVFPLFHVMSHLVVFVVYLDFPRETEIKPRTRLALTFQFPHFHVGMPSSSLHRPVLHDVAYSVSWVMACGMAVVISVSLTFPFFLCWTQTRMCPGVIPLWTDATHPRVEGRLLTERYNCMPLITHSSSRKHFCLEAF